MRYILFFILIINLFACVVPTNTTSKTSNPPAPDYNPTARALHPQFKIYHESDAKTKLYFKLFTKELYYLKIQNKNKAEILVHYDMIHSIENPILLDSASSKISIQKIAKQTDIITFLNLKHTDSLQYWIKIKLEDRYSRKTSTSYIKVDKKNPDNSQYYFLMKYTNKKPLFHDFVTITDSILIKHGGNKKTEKLFVKYYNRKFSVPLPPFSSLTQTNVKIKPDSVFELKCHNNIAVFYPSQKGIYRIQADTAENRGITQIKFDKHFPLFQTSADLAEALQYISTTEENMLMSESSNKKLAVDNFWLKAANDTERARQLIKVWYNRATYANYYFTSYKEGWKTDRGMIYMVFGPPQIVEYTETGERWTYTNKKNYQPVHFIFKRNDSRVSENDYILIRDGSYQSFWYDAVTTWRRGMVYHYAQ